MTGDLEPKLFQPIDIGSTSLKHRVVMAPLTRLRNSLEGVPSDMAAEYYEQRASDGGLIITEATFVAEEAGGMKAAPGELLSAILIPIEAIMVIAILTWEYLLSGIYSQEQISQWKKVSAAIHGKGGKVYMQLWALGRVASPDFVPTVYSAGTIPCEGKSKEITQMTEEDIERFVGHYKQAALNAIEAGMDGVEIHGANGYVSPFHLYHYRCSFALSFAVIIGFRISVIDL